MAVLYFAFCGLQSPPDGGNAGRSVIIVVGDLLPLVMWPTRGMIADESRSGLGNGVLNPNMHEKVLAGFGMVCAHGVFCRPSPPRSSTFVQLHQTFAPVCERAHSPATLSHPHKFSSRQTILAFDILPGRLLHTAEYGGISAPPATPPECHRRTRRRSLGIQMT
jgi:hypothetical protein